MTRDIYVSRTFTFEKEVARLNKRAARIGVQPIVLENLGKETRTRTIVTTGYGDVGVDNYSEPDMKIPVDVTHYRLTLQEPEERPWVAAGKITPIEGETPFVEALEPGFDPAPWAVNDLHCDHCHTNRRRSVFYVVRNRETGKFLKLGNNCADDYIGKDTLSALEFRDLVIANVGGDDEGFYPMDNGMRTQEVVEVRRCVAYAEALASVDGWINNRKDEYSGEILVEGTHRVAAARIRHSSLVGRNEHSKEAHDKLKEVEQDYDHDTDIAPDALIERLRELNGEDNSDFALALKNIVNYEWIPVQKASLAAYVGQYLRRIDEEAAREAKKATMKHVGTVGTRVDFTLTCKACPSFDSDFGRVNINIMEDAEGNELVWKTGTHAFHVGDKVNLKGTIKAHTERQGVPQTILTRCKVSERANATT